MAYFLVVLKAGPAVAKEARHADAHVGFIDSLIERRLVLPRRRLLGAGGLIDSNLVS